MRHPVWIVLVALLPLTQVQARPGVVAVSSEVNRSSSKELRRMDAGPSYAIAVGDFTALGNVAPRQHVPEPAVVASAVADAIADTLGSQVELTTNPDVVVACHYGEVSAEGPQPPVVAKSGSGGMRSISSALILGRGYVPILTGSERANLGAHESVDRFYLVVTAYNGAALRDGREEVLWQTRMSVDSLRTPAGEAWLAMAQAGAPHFGRYLKRPQFVRVETRGSPDPASTPAASLAEVLSPRANRIELALF